MKKEDARKLDTPAQQEKRDTAARLFKKEFDVKEIANIVGVHYSRIYEWKRLYKQGGVEALKIKKRGRVKSAGKVLTPKQENHIISLLIDKNPKELKFKFALWTRESVKALIDRELCLLFMMKRSMHRDSLSFYKRLLTHQTKKSI